MLLSASLRAAIAVGGGEGAHSTDQKIKQVSLLAHVPGAKADRFSSFLLLAPPSGALVVSQFQDPIPSSPVRHIGLVVLICSKLCLNAPD